MINADQNFDFDLVPNRLLLNARDCLLKPKCPGLVKINRGQPRRDND